jgi:hypothetical protein
MHFTLYIFLSCTILNHLRTGQGRQQMKDCTQWEFKTAGRTLAVSEEQALALSYPGAQLLFVYQLKSAVLWVSPPWLFCSIIFRQQNKLSWGEKALKQTDAGASTRELGRCTLE